MMFRCPYCGEKGFIPLQKMGLELGRLKGASSTCASCKKTCQRKLVVGGYYGHLLVSTVCLILFVLAIVLMDILRFNLLVLCALVMLIALYPIINYYFAYLDKFLKKDSEKEEQIIVAVDNQKLWPALRKGEIYELLSKGNIRSVAESEYTIAMLKDVRKNKDYIELTFSIVLNPADSRDNLKDDVIIRAFGKIFSGKLIGR